MDNLIIKDRFEELLIKNWTYFIDHKKIMAMVMEHARDSEFPIIDTNEIKTKGTQIKLSRFQPTGTGFTIWVEFSIPKDNALAVGTSEIHLSNLGVAERTQTLGTVFRKK